MGCFFNGNEHPPGQRADPAIPDEKETPHSVTYEWNGDVPEGAELPESLTEILPGIKVSVAGNPSADGYTFSSWTATYKDVDGKDQKVEITDGSFTMPEADVTITSSWTVNSTGGTDPDEPGHGAGGTDIPDDNPPLSDLLWPMCPRPATCPPSGRR